MDTDLIGWCACLFVHTLTISEFFWCFGGKTSSTGEKYSKNIESNKQNENEIGISVYARTCLYEWYIFVVRVCVLTLAYTVCCTLSIVCMEKRTSEHFDRITIARNEKCSKRKWEIEIEIEMVIGSMSNENFMFLRRRIYKFTALK